ncbi:hypothetical protein [Methylomonas koyamae]|uniref:hypothetical protein n=1 Tax=Methylomonas koyamae TaxID=702114 RepID=UPI000A6C84AE|nr:hypothetical protein [Methylomonas koyamae]
MAGVAKRVRRHIRRQQPEQSLLRALEKTAAAFARYLPVQDGDINELPDRLDIDL